MVLVLVTVMVVVASALPVTVAEAIVPQVTGLVALDGLVVTEQVRFTVPVKPSVGSTAIVEVLPEVAPAATVTLVADRAKVGDGAPVGQALTTLAILSEPSPVARSKPVAEL